jgi:exosortase/archaeosortase family protein
MAPPSGGHTLSLRGVASSPPLRAAIVVGAAVAAYHYSLSSLLGTLSADTPLAYLGLAPLIALGLAVALSRPSPGALEVSDRTVDLLVGVPLLGTAMFMTVVLPARMSILFWYYRVDLLSLPLFVAGAVALLFGAATLWRIRYAIGFLLLAWPVPYTWALNHGMTSFSGVTLAALHRLVRVVHVAVLQPGGDGSVFNVTHAGVPFSLSVASACTGVDSFVGFFLVGLAFLAVVDGARPAKALWLVSGMVLVYVLNLLRIILIFWAGSRWGESVAIDGLHPVLGLILFCAGVAIMVGALGRFRLQVKSRPVEPVPADVTAPAPGSASDPGPAPAARRRWRVAGRLRGVAVALAAVTAVVAITDGGFGRYGPLAGALGSPRLASFAADPIQLPGWSVQPIDQYPWAHEYFGTGATWTRFEYTPTAAYGPATVLADVIDTSDLSSFSTYDVIACYDYHGYGLSGVRRVALGNGVDATTLTFQVTGLAGPWNALYWIWPVKAAQGVRYERVVLLAPVSAGYTTTAAANGDTTAALVGDKQASRDFLLRFAQALVGTRTRAPGGQAA